MNKYKTKPILATILNNGKEVFGKTRFKKASLRPIAEGPSRIPPVEF